MRAKGMIDRVSLKVAKDALALVDAGILAGFPPSEFPMAFPTVEGMYEVEPVDLVGGGSSSTTTLAEIPDGGSYVSETFRNAWDVEWLAGLVLGLLSWASAGRTEMENNWPDLAAMFQPFGSGNAGYDRRKWSAGSVSENFDESYDDSPFEMVTSSTAGGVVMGVGFPAWGFTETTLIVLEDSIEHPVVSWVAGDLTPIDGFTGETEWEIRAKAAKARVDALMAYAATHVGVPTLSERFRIWRNGSQTDGRGI